MTPICRPPRCAFRPILAVAVPWGGAWDAPHDEPSWLIRVQRTIPDLRVVQLPEMLSIYNVHDPSVSRDLSDHTDTYIGWGLEYLGRESPRLLGDYLCTSPVSAAVSAGSLGGCDARCGRRYDMAGPVPVALAYAALNAARLVVRRAESCHPPMTMKQGQLAPEERRALLYGPVYRILGMPIVALLSLANTAIVVRETGEAVFGLVSLSRRSRCCSPSRTSASVPP